MRLRILVDNQVTYKKTRRPNQTLFPGSKSGYGRKWNKAQVLYIVGWEQERPISAQSQHPR